QAKQMPKDSVFLQQSSFARYNQSPRHLNSFPTRRSSDLVKYVMDLGYTNALNLEAGHTNGDHYDSTYIYGDFYFNHTFSVGAGYQDEFDNDIFTLRTRKFFNHQFSGELAFSKADDGKGFSVGASMRF